MSYSVLVYLSRYYILSLEYYTTRSSLYSVTLSHCTLSYSISTSYTILDDLYSIRLSYGDTTNVIYSIDH